MIFINDHSLPVPFNIWSLFFGFIKKRLTAKSGKESKPNPE